jgi:hypothetical protein
LQVALGVPISLCSTIENRSAIEILTIWVNDLKSSKVKFPTFERDLKSYRSIKAKIDSDPEYQIDLPKIIESAPRSSSSVFSKTPNSAVKESSNIAADSLSKKINHGELDLLLDFTDKLTNDFLSDLSKVTSKKQIILMLDEYETITSLDAWVFDFTKKLHTNCFIVIAGRATPNWSDVWPEWIRYAHLEKLDVMSDEDVREFITKNLKYRDLSPESELINSIIESGIKTPLSVSMAVSAYAEYGISDFRATKQFAIGDVIGRLLRYLPQEIKPALDIASLVRKFDGHLLEELIEGFNAEKSLKTLIELPFVMTNKDGFVLHSGVRDLLEEQLKLNNRERYVELHRQIAKLFETKLHRAQNQEDSWLLAFELLYHLVHADERAGLLMCEELAEGLILIRDIEKLQILLNEASNYPLNDEQSVLWRQYFVTRLKQIEEKTDSPTWLYKMLGDNPMGEIDKSEYDVFISHAWEDKPFARELADALSKMKLKVWYDEFTLKVGDRLRRSIDHGLSNSKYGVVVLSKHFFSKEWPQKELDGLVSRETANKKILLPIWHNITADEVRKYSPTLADRIAVTSDKGVDQVVAELLRAMQS